MTGAVTALILCGGRGTRAYPLTEQLPKPLLPVADRPLLEHLLEVYAAQGFVDFVLAAGYRADAVEDFAASLPTTWSVEVVDTGEDTGTAARVRACRDRLSDPCFVTYGDGLGDVDLRALLEFHAQHDGAATLTTVPLPSQYGTVEVAGDGCVTAFREKPSLPDHLINAGFFVFDQRAFDAAPGDDLEREVLPSLGAQGELFAYHHRGFWKSMDTFKDSLDLTALAQDGQPPWHRVPSPRSGPARSPLPGSSPEGPE